jgi:hypothetical protein
MFGVPQGSVLGPMFYCMYTRPVADIARQFGMHYMTYADDTQAYDVLKIPAQWAQTSERISNYVTAMQAWMNCNMLKLNPDKFEFIVFHPKCQAPNFTISRHLFHPNV